jgi:homoserine kinase type II
MGSLKFLGARAKRFVQRVWNRPVDQSFAISNYDLHKIVAAWEIGPTRSMKILSGGTSSNWVVKTTGGKYVLRNAGTNGDYINFQIFVINQLCAGDFPYSIPQPLQAGGAYRVSYRGRYWLLYRFIEGRPLKAISVKQSGEIGRLVACYHAIVRDLDCSHIGDFTLPLFDADGAHTRLRESVEHLVAKKPRGRIERLLSAAMDSILEAYHQIPVADKEGIRALPNIPVYNDWHGHNVLGFKDSVIGLVDFDSLVTAPRIVDVQNGLLYAAGTDQGIDLSKMQAFLQGYGSRLQLTRPELWLIPSLMIDRVASIISNVLVERIMTESRRKDGVLFFLVNLVSWVIHNKRTFVDHLFASSGGGGCDVR